jgi:hypothetical protein
MHGTLCSDVEAMLSTSSELAFRPTELGNGLLSSLRPSRMMGNGTDDADSQRRAASCRSQSERLAAMWIR